MAGEERLRKLEERYEGYQVYDNAGEKIGKVDELFVDETDREEYIGVKMGLFGLSGTTLIPMDVVRANEGDRSMQVAESRDNVKNAPTYGDEEITPEFENSIRRHFGLQSLESSTNRGYSGSGTTEDRPDAGSGTRGEGDSRTRVRRRVTREETEYLEEEEDLEPRDSE